MYNTLKNNLILKPWRHAKNFQPAKKKRKDTILNKCLHSFINTKTQPINQLCNGYSGTENEQSSKKTFKILYFGNLLVDVCPKMT